MNWLSRLLVLSIITLGSIGLDQCTKMGAKTHLQGHASISFLHDIIHFVYAENPGTMLGIGSGLPENMRFVFFVLFIGIVLLVASAFVLFKPLQQATVLATSLIVGGGVSNLIDRLIHDGSVIDFMLIRIGSLESGIFNTADIAITLGACTLCLSWITAKRQKEIT